MAHYSNKLLSFLLAAMLLFLTITASAQQSSDNKSQLVKWQMLSGKNSEFFFVMPEGSSIYTDKNYYLDSDTISEIDSEKTLVRTINNTVLLITLFEGNGRGIKNKLISYLRKNEENDSGSKYIKYIASDKEKLKSLKIEESEINGFGFANASLESMGFSAKVQIFWNKNHVYYLQTLSHLGNDPIVKNYFESVKLVNKDKVVSPNLNNKTEDFAAAKLLLPKPIKEESKPSNEIIDGNKLDQIAVVGYVPPIPPLSQQDRKFDRKYNPVKMKILFLADGTIGEVKFITKLSKTFEDKVLKTVKGTKFLPAKVNGKVVSFYGEVTYTYYF
jgi:hypothetical protein